MQENSDILFIGFIDSTLFLFFTSAILIAFHEDAEVTFIDIF